jgi:arylsulfatase A-like enzyme
MRSAIAAAGLALIALAAAPSMAAAQSADRPNIVVIMTDDQEADTTSYMPELESLVADQGTTFENSVVSLSHCCPSRATFLTGQYAKNHGVLTSADPPSGYHALKPTLGNTLSPWLQDAGYATGHVGHYLNGYAETFVPPGWSEFYGSWEAGAYGYYLNENGLPRYYGAALPPIVGHQIIDPAIYNTDIYAGKATDFVARRAPSSQPFFLYVGTFAPHTECSVLVRCNSDPRAAPRHEGTFENDPLPKGPNYNEADVSDKPSLIRNLPPLGPAEEANLTELYQDRNESLLAVDEMIGNLVDTLTAAGELDETVIIFTSDNGVLLGEHRWNAGKVFPYEESIKVPLIVRGPGVSAGELRDELVANIDLAPTIVDLAGAAPGRPQDGRSLVPLLREGGQTPAWDRPVFLEGHFNEQTEYGAAAPRIVFDGVRTDRYMYARYENGEEELYDLQTDPYELQSRHNDPAYAAIEEELRQLTARLRECEGSTCSGVSGPAAPGGPQPGPGARPQSQSPAAGTGSKRCKPKPKPKPKAKAKAKKKKGKCRKKRTKKPKG